MFMLSIMTSDFCLPPLFFLLNIKHYKFVNKPSRLDSIVYYRKIENT